MWGKENCLTLFWVLIGATIMDYQIQTSLQIKNKVSRESINPTSEFFFLKFEISVLYMFLPRKETLFPFLPKHTNT